ncbi:uncharacterized protein [Nicotiana tomentosiformis]|uniref:uncharacterized protein n=1 Tax=Nicotiana tomentosiformis TaxID=4098 RepID=UPI00388C67EF
MELNIIVVYAKCTASERKELWTSLEDTHSVINGPWCIGGDFNVIMDLDKKLGAILIEWLEVSTSPTVWTTVRWQTLDLLALDIHCVIIRDQGKEFGRDLIESSSTTLGLNFFRIALSNILTDIYELVKEVWDTHVQGNPMWRLQQKLKILSNKLSQWSRKSIGNIYDQVIKWETEVESLEELDQVSNTEVSGENLNKGQAEYIKWQAMQESLLKQNSQIQWFEEGDCNIKYFHSVIRERKKKIQIHRIKNQKGN